MDISTLIELYGPFGLIIGGLAIWGMRERSERIDQTNGRFEDLKDHASQLMENTRTLDRALDVIGKQGNVR